MNETENGPALPFPSVHANQAADDDELRPWMEGAEAQAGDFLKTLVQAARRADTDNYPVVRLALVYFAAKYPEYHHVGIARLKQFPYGVQKGSD